MISLIRLDDRLVHGQVAYAWKASLGYNAIVIASDEAASNDLRKQALKMCCPADTRLAIKSVKDAAELLANDKLKALKILVVTDNSKDLYELCKVIDEKPLVNIGGIQKKSDTKELIRAVHLTKEDIEYFDKVVDLGYEIECRLVPNDAKVVYATQVKKIK